MPFYDCRQVEEDEDVNHYDDVGVMMSGSGGCGGPISVCSRSDGLNRGDSGYHTTHSQCTYSSTGTVSEASSLQASSLSQPLNNQPPPSMAPPPPPPPSQTSSLPLNTPQILPGGISDRAYLFEMQSRSRLPISIRSNLNLSGCVDLSVMRPQVIQNQAHHTEEPTAFKPISNDPFKRNTVRRSLDSSIAANAFGKTSYIVV